MAPKFPMDLYHATDAPIIVKNEQEYEAAQRKGYGEKYLHQEFPKAVYHKQHTAADPRTLTVENPDELKAALANDYLEEPPSPKPTQTTQPKQPTGSNR